MSEHLEFRLLTKNGTPVQNSRQNAEVALRQLIPVGYEFGLKYKHGDSLCYVKLPESDNPLITSSWSPRNWEANLIARKLRMALVDHRIPWEWTLVSIISAFHMLCREEQRERNMTYTPCKTRA